MLSLAATEAWPRRLVSTLDLESGVSLAMHLECPKGQEGGDPLKKFKRPHLGMIRLD